ALEARTQPHVLQVLHDRAIADRQLVQGGAGERRIFIQNLAYCLGRQQRDQGWHKRACRLQMRLIQQDRGENEGRRRTKNRECRLAVPVARELLDSTLDEHVEKIGTFALADEVDPVWEALQVARRDELREGG